MSDLIERQAAIDAVRSYYDEIYGDPLSIEERIEALPSAQPEREKGKWAKISPANIYECSKCGKNVMTNDISEYNFCHGCGADMRGENERN